MGKREGAAWKREGDDGKSPQSSKREGSRKDCELGREGGGND